MRVLVVDDDKRFASVLCRVFRQAGFEDVSSRDSAEAALDFVRSTPCDLLVTDLRLGGMDGLKLMSEVKRRFPRTVIILMTAFADVETAKSALKRGALDYLVKPFDNDELISLAHQAQAQGGSSSGSDMSMFAGMLGESPVMKGIFDRIKKAAATDASVLILGESGTGKELVARAVHDMSIRHNSRFVPIHTPAIPDTLLEGELFGYEKGAFTGADARKLGQLEFADGGTVFFDEIADMPLLLQPKILRFLQEHQFTRLGDSNLITVDVRIIAATNRDVEAEVKAGRFREDLLYRLDVIRIEMPALRERGGDIEMFIHHLMNSLGSCADRIAPEAMELLKKYSWPGNVRELENMIERLIVETGDGIIDRASLPPKITDPQSPGSEEQDSDEINLDLGVNERKMIEEAIRKTGGNKAQAAKLLGITRRKLYSRMEILGMK